jgi:outer membrane biosynthesis protein TonB
MDNRFLELLRKWLSGDFRQTDAERLQSLMEKDDFQRAAFEGFAENSETVSTKEVSAMRRRFDQKYGAKKGGRIVSMNWILAAAACGILVLATVWLFDKSAEKIGDNGAISMNQDLSQPTEYQVVTSKMDSISSGQYQPEKAPTATGKTDQASAQAIVKNPDIRVAATENYTDEIVEIGQKPSEQIAENTEKDRVFDAEKVEIAPPASAPIVQSDVQITQNNSVNYQSYPSNGKTSTTLPTENVGNGKAKKQANPSKIPAAEAKKNIGEGANNNLEDAKKNTDNKSETAKTRTTNAENDRPTPEIGWPAYQKYLDDNKKAPSEGFSGEVVVKFYVDKTGRPIQMLVTKSVGGGCDDEVIRLLENGPNWLLGKKSVEISVRF